MAHHDLKLNEGKAELIILHSRSSPVPSFLIKLDATTLPCPYPIYPKCYCQKSSLWLSLQPHHPFICITFLAFHCAVLHAHLLAFAFIALCQTVLAYIFNQVYTTLAPSSPFGLHKTFIFFYNALHAIFHAPL